VSTAREVGTIAAPSRFRRTAHLLRRPFRLSLEQASFRKRQFVSADPSKRLALEAVGETFIGGYNAALMADHPEEIFQHIAGIVLARRGFAVEGAAMGCAVADALPFRDRSFATHMRAYDREFSYLTHVGAGWALARIPWRRAQIFASLDPIHHWLAYDGMGFHDTYFRHRRVLTGWRRIRSGYAVRAYDQGVGRALWFVTGGSAAAATELISGFTAPRRSDLWSGLGLAMAYAGPVDDNEIIAAFSAGGANRHHFAQGAAFACEARVRARHIPVHTELAARIVSGIGADELSALVRHARTKLPRGDTDTPAYEIWRRKVAAAMAAAAERRS
jgi:hypothetical protein